MMKELTLAEIKQASFEVLSAIKELCDQHDISYSLTGGTLIGAVRHKGFIPWDDDVDIMMPRPDYNRFLELMKTTEHPVFRVLSTEQYGTDYCYPFAKACRKGTLVKEKDRLDTTVDLGVYVDIFPVDGMGNSFVFAKLRCMIFTFIHGLKLVSGWKTYHTSKLRKWYYEPFRYVCYLVGKLLGVKLTNKLFLWFLSRKEYETSRYAGRMVGDYGSKEIMERGVFESTVKVTFEGEEFDAIAAYDTFLTALYGDYMTLPPAEKQVTHHEFNAYCIED